LCNIYVDPLAIFYCSSVKEGIETGGCSMINRPILLVIYSLVSLAACSSPIAPAEMISPTDTGGSKTPVNAAAVITTPLAPAEKPTGNPLPKGTAPVDTIKPDDESKSYSGQVLFIFGEGYDHRHYEGTRSALERAGYRVLVASITTEPVEGVIAGHGFELTSQIGGTNPIVKPDLILENVQIGDYQAVIFISDNELFAARPPRIHQIVTQAVENKVVLAAQEFSIYHLADAGLLQGVKVTTNPLICQEMETSYGAECTLMPVQRDKGFVTADPTYSTVSFVRAILAEIESAGS
jgi:putative intracellular protease/amidase